MALREEDALGYEIELVEDGYYVRLKLVSEVTRVDHEELRAKGVSVLAETGWAKALIDVTRAAPEMTVSDDYQFTSGHKTRLPLKFRAAIVHRADQTKRYQFIEDVAVNRGVKIRKFTDEAEALGWLLDG